MQHIDVACAGMRYAFLWFEFIISTVEKSKHLAAGLIAIRFTYCVNTRNDLFYTVLFYASNSEILQSDDRKDRNLTVSEYASVLSYVWNTYEKCPVLISIDKYLSMRRSVGVYFGPAHEGCYTTEFLLAFFTRRFSYRIET